MFTGIIETVGTVTDVHTTPDGQRLHITTDVATALSEGQSISVNGACLTVEDAGPDGFQVFLASETVAKTTLGHISTGDLVNLERALQANGRFDGHFVQGHVDTTTPITGIRELGEDWEYEFALPENHAHYIVAKGSIALDGISLTVADRTSNSFTVAIVPSTYEHTALSAKTTGDPVNVEVDIVAKYVEQVC